MSANPYVFIPSFSAGVPWTEDEHRLFLLGLQKLGKVSSGGYIYFRTESFRRHPAFLSGRRAHGEASSRGARPNIAFIGPISVHFRIEASLPAGRGDGKPLRTPASLRFSHTTGGTLRALRWVSMLHRQRSA